MELQPLHRKVVGRLPEPEVKDLVGVEEVGGKQRSPGLFVERIEPPREAFVIVVARFKEPLGDIRKIHIIGHTSFHPAPRPFPPGEPPWQRPSRPERCGRRMNKYIGPPGKKNRCA